MQERVGPLQHFRTFNFSDLCCNGSVFKSKVEMVMPISFLLTRFSLKVAAVFCAGAILGILAVLFAPMQVDVQMRTKEKGFLQCFVDTGAGFNEAQSKRTELSESPDFSHYEVSIRAWGVRTIRIDPFETKGQFEIRALKIGYPFWYRQWFGHDELAHLISPHGI